MGKFRRRATWRYGETYKRNEDIRINNLKVILPGWDGAKEMTRDEAMRLAEEYWEDLVLISPTSRPPICKIIDYGQFLYQQKKKDNVKHKNNKKSEIKWIRLTFNIWQHDFDIKLKKAKEFLEEKNFVKVTMQFKWRELLHSSMWLKKIKDFIEWLSEVSKVEQWPSLLWKQATALLIPTKTKQ